MARKLRVWVDPKVCVGNAMCEAIAASVFRLNENRQSEVVDPAGDSVEKILEAAENCPVSAIRVEDAETDEKLFPLVGVHQQTNKNCDCGVRLCASRQSDRMGSRAASNPGSTDLQSASAPPSIPGMR